MLIAVSPYHLTSREPPAMASLLLAEQVVTLLPAPRSRGAVTPADFHAAARDNPRYRDLMEQWRWLAPLWAEGVVSDRVEGLDPADDVRSAAIRLEEDGAFASLRPFMRTHLFEDDEQSLQFIASDLLKGGPDPAITVPVLAGLDAFAARLGITVARANATSVAQRAELSMATRRGGLVVPVLLQASAERILDARDRLEQELADLREAITEALDAAEPDAAPLADAARRYNDAFELERADLTEVGDPDEVRVVCGMCAIMLADLPADAVLRSSTLAASAVTGVRRSAQTQTLPAVAYPADAQRVRTLIIKPLGR